MEEVNIVVGLHSIGEVLKNRIDDVFKIVCTKDGLDELLKVNKINKNILREIKIEMLSSHKIQEHAKEDYKQFDYFYSRVPSQIYAMVRPLEEKGPDFLYNYIDSCDDVKLIALDQVTDINNGAAILRTASFYGVHSVIIGQKGSFKMTPSFFRIASGATEYVNIIVVNNLSKTLTKLIEKDVTVIGLSEHSNIELDSKSKRTCLVLGSEDKGLSNAVSRVVQKTLCLTPFGKTQSLNVSVASAVAMERVFSIK